MPYNPSKPPKKFQKYGSKGARGAAEAFNSALERYGNEKTAFQVAHTVGRKVAEHSFAKDGRRKHNRG